MSTKRYYFSQRCHGIFTKEITVEADSEEEAIDRIENGHETLQIENGDIDEVITTHDLELDDIEMLP